MANDLNTRNALITLATKKDGPTILPVIGHTSVDDYFVQYDDVLTLWYNTPDNSTHVVTSKKLEQVNV